MLGNQEVHRPGSAPRSSKQSARSSSATVVSATLSPAEARRRRQARGSASASGSGSSESGGCSLSSTTPSDVTHRSMSSEPTASRPRRVRSRRCSRLLGSTTAGTYLSPHVVSLSRALSRGRRRARRRRRSIGARAGGRRRSRSVLGAEPVTQFELLTVPRH